jgi:cobalt/nickel transport system permease protein
LGFLSAAMACALLHRLGPATLALVGALTLAALARAPWPWLIRRLIALALVLLFFLVWLPLFPDPQDSTFTFLGLELSFSGCYRALTLLIRTLALATILLVLWATTEPPELFQAAAGLRVPGVLVQVTALTYRYLFLLVEEWRRLRIAWRSRGFRLRMNRHGYRTVGHAAGALLVKSHDRADRVAQAMRCRGFDGRFRTLHVFQTRRRDVAAAGAMVVASLALVVWDWWSSSAN